MKHDGDETLVARAKRGDETAFARLVERPLVEAGDPDPIKASIVVAINEVLDAHAKRIAVVFDRLPFIVFALLVLVAAASLAVAAHNAGINGKMSRWRMSIFALVLAALMLVILDFDQGRRGFIQITDRPLEAAVREMESALAEEG